MTTYNHAFDIAFSLVNNSPTGEATALDLLAGIAHRGRVALLIWV